MIGISLRFSTRLYMTHSYFDFVQLSFSSLEKRDENTRRKSATKLLLSHWAEYRVFSYFLSLLKNSKCKNEYLLGVKLNSAVFQLKKSLLIVYGTLYFTQSIVLQKLRPLRIFHAENGFHTIRNPCFLRWSIHRFIFR